MKEAFELIRKRIEEIRVLEQQYRSKALKENDYVRVNATHEGISMLNHALTIVDSVEAEYGNGKTNADRIRSMSDEELAEFFARKSPCDYYCNYSKRACNGVSCKQGILDWLKSNTTD